MVTALLNLPPVLIAEEEKIFEEDSRENQSGVQEKWVFYYIVNNSVI